MERKVLLPKRKRSRKLIFTNISTRLKRERRKNLKTNNKSNRQGISLAYSYSQNFFSLSPSIFFLSVECMCFFFILYNHPTINKRKKSPVYFVVIKNNSNNKLTARSANARARAHVGGERRKERFLLLFDHSFGDRSSSIL